MIMKTYTSLKKQHYYLNLISFHNSIFFPSSFFMVIRYPSWLEPYDTFPKVNMAKKGTDETVETTKQSNKKE